MSEASDFLFTLTLKRTLGVARLLTDLRGAGCHLGQSAKTILRRGERRLSPLTVDLHSVTVGQLGLAQGASYPVIMQHVLMSGWSLCPIEYAALFRLFYQEQPMRECLLIASRARSGSDGVTSILAADHTSDGLWLRAFDAGPASYYGPTCRLVILADQPGAGASICA